MQHPRTTCASDRHSNPLLMYLPYLVTLFPQVNYQSKCNGMSKLNLNLHCKRNSSSWHSSGQQDALQLKMSSAKGYFRDSTP